jgi:uncharacterized protein (DUF1778 family)
MLGCRVLLIEMYGKTPYNHEVERIHIMDYQDTPMGRTERFEARLDQATQSLLKHAAELQGRSLSDFVVGAAREAALSTIAEMETIRLSREAQGTFVSALLEPPKANAALKRAAKRHGQLIEPV